MGLMELQAAYGLMPVAAIEDLYAERDREGWMTRFTRWLTGGPAPSPG